MEYSIDRATKKDSGTYVCRATNDFGTEEAEISVEIFPAPMIEVVPSKVSTVEGAKVRLESVFENQGDGDQKITWRHGNKEVFEYVS